MTFTEDDTLTLIEHVIADDTSGIVGWLEAHILTHRDMHTLYEFVARAINATWPMGITKSLVIQPGDHWALTVLRTSDLASTEAGRIVTAAMNADWDMCTALIIATLKQDEEHHGAVLVHLLVALASGMRAAIETVANSAPTTDQPVAEPARSGHDEGCADFYVEYGAPEGGLCKVCGESADQPDGAS